MKTKTLLLFIVLLPGLMGFTPLPGNQPAASPRPLAASIPTSAFGYTFNSAQSFNWRDISALPNADISANYEGSEDDGNSTVELGFSFPFFDNSYTSMAVSINGQLLFGEDPGKHPENTFIPFLEEPNNYIAPFWDDLYLGSMSEVGNTRRIYYHVYSGETPKKAVVQWYVTRREEADILEFQAILSATGDIVFNYKTLNGTINEATVGIEDADGVDGMQSFYNEAGLTTNLAIGYLYPSGASRLSGKASTHNLGGFLSNRTATFPFWVQNTGTVDASLSLSALREETNASGTWTVEFLASDGITVLTDWVPYSNSGVDTPVIPVGEKMYLYVRVTGPTALTTGKYARFTLSIYPATVPTRKFQISLSTAVPAPFAQAFVDTGKGMYVQLSRTNDVSTVFAVDYFTGSTLTMSETARYGMIFAWEHQQQYHDTTANIEYVVVDSLSNTTSNIRTIQYNPDLVKDEYPKVTMAPDGRSGFMFNRKMYDPDKMNWIENTYFVLLEPDGSNVNGVEPFPVTGNTEHTGQTSTGPRYNAAPSLAVTSDNRFMLAWQESRPVDIQQTDDLFVQVYHSDGSVDPATPAPKKLTASAAGSSLYINPDLTELPGDQFLLTYTIYDPATFTYTIAYRVLDASGNEVLGENTIPGMQGQRVEAAFLGNDSRHVLLSWSNPDTQHIGYAVLDENMALLTGPVELANSINQEMKYLEMDYPSVTRDMRENGIITWGDTNDLYLYYALVDSTGAVLTPPMIFRSGGWESYPRLKTSQAGEGNTTLSTANIYRRYMPVSSGK